MQVWNVLVYAWWWNDVEAKIYREVGGWDWVTTLYTGIEAVLCYLNVGEKVGWLEEV